MAKPKAVHRTKTYPQIARENIKLGICLSNIAWVEEQVRERLSTLDLGDVPALKLYADIQFRKIAKVLPDLKSVDHQGDLTVSHTIKVSVT